LLIANDKKSVYRNIRVEGRSIVVVDGAAAKKVNLLFHLIAYENLTIDDLLDRLAKVGNSYRPSTLRFPRIKLHAILRDRAYIGEVTHRGEWFQGKHEPVIERDVWNRVQASLGNKVYRSNEHTYAGSLIVCGHCGHFITGEQVTKKTKAGENKHNYYRCTKYASKGHPRIRLREADLDEQVMQLFESIRIKDDSLRKWFGMVLRSKTRDDQEHCKAEREDLQRQPSSIVEQQDRLLNLRLLEEIDATTFATKQRELRGREADISYASKLRTVLTTKWPIWPSKCLNSRKPLRINGLRRITPKNGRYSKSSV
jgi:hypothetical protein